MGIEEEMKKPKEDVQEYAVIKDFVNKDDGKEYRIGSSILLSAERAVTLSELGYIENEVPV